MIWCIGCVPAIARQSKNYFNIITEFSCFLELTVLCKGGSNQQINVCITFKMKGRWMKNFEIDQDRYTREFHTPAPSQGLYYPRQVYATGRLKVGKVGVGGLDRYSLVGRQIGRQLGSIVYYREIGRLVGGQIDRQVCIYYVHTTQVTLIQ